MEKCKQIFKNLFFALLWWLIYDALVFSAFYLMYNFNEELGTTSGGFEIFATTSMETNWFCYLGGAALSVATLILIWKKLLRPTWEGVCRAHWSGAVLWVLLAIPALMLAFAGEVFAEFCGLGLTGKMDPEILEYYVFPYFGFAVIYLIVQCVLTARRLHHGTETV